MKVKEFFTLPEAEQENVIKAARAADEAYDRLCRGRESGEITSFWITVVTPGGTAVRADAPGAKEGSLELINAAKSIIRALADRTGHSAQ